MELATLALREFGVPLEPSEYQFVEADTHGCVGHVGLDVRMVWFEDDPHVAVGVAAIRFVVTREDCRELGVATGLMLRAHGKAACLGLAFAVLFSGVEGFYRTLGYRTVRPGAMVCALDGRSKWPAGAWETVGKEW